MIRASVNETSASSSIEPAVTKCEPIPEVLLAHSPEIKDVFDVEMVRQQMMANAGQDIPIDEP